MVVQWGYGHHRQLQLIPCFAPWLLGFTFICPSSSTMGLNIPQKYCMYPQTIIVPTALEFAGWRAADKSLEELRL